MNQQIKIESNGKDRLWSFGRTSPTLRNLESAFRASLGLHNKLLDARSALEASGQYTPRGAADHARKAAREQILPDIIRGVATLQAARKSAKDRLAALRPAMPDRQDLVGFFRRESFRDELRRMPREQRDHLLTRSASELDSEQVAAALEVTEWPWTAPEARLISPATRSVLERRLMPADELARIGELEAAIAYAGPSIEQGKAEIQAELGIAEPDFTALMDAEKIEPEPAPQKVTIAPVQPTTEEEAAPYEEPEEIKELWASYKERMFGK